MSGIPEIALQEAIVPLEHLHRLMPGDPHDREVVNPGPTHIGDCCVPEVVEVEPLDSGSATGGLECPLG